jgi:folate-binding protein YgfZ
VSDAVAEAMRIEAGRPRFGVDMTEETIPLEAGLLDRAISQTKGCYVGQEVIIRVLHRGAGRVAKRLARLSAGPTAELPPADARIVVDGRDVGRVTSAAWSPQADGPLALGYVARDVAEPGREVVLSWAGQNVPARITGLAG